MEFDKEDNHKNNELIYRLIRMVRSPGDKEFVRPDKDTISAYLLNSASEEQRKIMQKALLKSESFRREILVIAEDIEKVSEANEELLKKTLGNTPVPNLNEYLHRYGKTGNIPGDSLSVWRKLRELLFPRLFIPAPVAGLVMVLLLSIFTIQYYYSIPKSWNFTYEQQDNNFWRTNQTRGIFTKTYANALDAAFNEFRLLMDYHPEIDDFMLKPPENRAQYKFHYYTVKFELLRETGKLLANFSAQIPSHQDVQVWAFDVDHKKAYRYNIRNDNLKLNWPSYMGKRGIITVTYKTDSGYRAKEGYTFSAD